MPLLPVGLHLCPPLSSLRLNIVLQFLSISSNLIQQNEKSYAAQQETVQSIPT